jgi:hypothetical protein
MSLSFPADATTARDSAGAEHIANLPTGITAGDLLCVGYLCNDSTRHLTPPAGWDGEIHYSGDGSIGTVGVVYKRADGAEGATETFSYNAGTSFAGSVSFRVTDHDGADPFNSINYVGAQEASEDPWTIASGLLTGVANSDSNIVLIGGAKAVRTITAQDSGQALITSVNDGYSIHALRELSPGSSNSAYSNDMSGSRAWLQILLEIKAAAAGGTVLINSDHPFPLSTSQGVSADKPAPLTSNQTISANIIHPLVWTAAVARQIALQFDSLASLNADAETPVMMLEMVITDAPSPVSWQGALVVNADAPTPVSWVSNLVSNFSAPAEWSAQLEKDFSLPASITNELARSLVVPMSYQEFVEHDSDLPIAWQGALVVNADRVLPIDWRSALTANQPLPLATIRTLTTDQPIPVSSASGIVADQAGTLDWLGQLLVDHGLPLEWSGTLIVASDHPIPVAWGGVSGFVDGNVNVFHLDYRSVLWQLPARSVTWQFNKQ